MSHHTARASRILVLVFALALFLIAFAQPAPALAQGPQGAPASEEPVGPPLGIVHPRGQSRSIALSSTTVNLVYHSGTVMHTNTVYAIYWIPYGYTASTGYTTMIAGFFKNVAAASGSTGNVYYSTTQYSDSLHGLLIYGSTYGGGYLDQSPLPTSGCTDAYTKVCLSDSQIRSEIKKVIAAKGWTTSTSHLFFLFTAKGIGSCAGSSCAFTQYCAYHSWSGTGSSVLLYANMPYADTVPSACDIGQHPNNNDADATINVTSHEHAEAITDPLGNAWYDSQGYEDGDKCAWSFGVPLGGTNGAFYNQVINGAHYYLQQEWSNKSIACVLKGY